ncbi:hypothetical protein BASA50_001153 [Batrachochytrium salamandrivorans]|uniref:LIM zinc-binding domain-containing protein n=1 Tax=Batrachochytrium salamandrivorans TaxID=1357716 RepID=A0ABQ8EUQ0_9FUNG|nr:hypothetical protein BASA60_008820 [Batrachochytrium salamandrivorans]KAH6578054.1 hypothetical protein BASA62_000493 [Batrachochytrium salamandrivorans]KAH6579127.1 hypothetical protein BASA61_010429 [Batrachochytrium salamandrivorans]KAH6585544.1 hypothetical protein BASA50_001153 [Batrachochytrium salamandrivorans]KAH9248374.1 hypothetical protein BASA81_013960 [Batrachochytrium salamandrivorans]
MSKYGGASATCMRCTKAVYFQEQIMGPGGTWHKNCLTCKECNKRLDSTNLAEKNKEAFCKTCHGRLYGPKGYGYGGGAGVLSTETRTSDLSNSTAQAEALEPTPAPAASAGSESVVFPKKAVYSPSTAMNSGIPAAGLTSGTIGIRAAYEGGVEGTSSISTSTPPLSTRPSTASKYGGSPACAKCTKAVYFAEQVIGPGNIKYHKTCFKCSSCNKQLDTGTASNKDTAIFCKPCHGRQFGPKGYGFGGGAGVLSTEGH